VALGRAYYHWASARADQNLDPTSQLKAGLQTLESLSLEKREYIVENLIGSSHLTWSEYEGQHGLDPSSHLTEAISAYERMTRIEPRLAAGWLNLASCFRQRALLPKAAHTMEDLQKALKAVEAGRSLNYRNWVPHFLQGGLLCDLALHKQEHGGDPEPDLQQSLEAYQRGLTINRSNPNLYNGYGISCVGLAKHTWETGGNPRPRLAQAKEAYRKAAALAPDQVFAYQNLGDLLIWKARWEGGAAAGQALQEAEALLRKGLRLAPGHVGSLANLGRVSAVRIESALLTGLDPMRNLNMGEVALARSLAQDPRDRDSLLYLGELRSALARWKALHHHAEAADFEKAASSFKRALEVVPDAIETQLALANLFLSWAQWERTTGRDCRSSLASGRNFLSRVLAARPRLGEAIALKGALDLEEAELLQAGARVDKEQESLKDFNDAFALNQNLVGTWKSWSNRAQVLARVAP
jgi:tetratricopeptide (TPR) repeat protein